MRKFVGAMGLLTSIVLASGLATGCGGKPSKEDCSKALDHMADIAIGDKAKDLPADKVKEARDQMKEGLKQFLDECTEKGTKSEIDCVMKATDLAAVQKCDD